MSKNMTRYEAVEHVVRKGHEIATKEVVKDHRKAASQAKAADVAYRLLFRPGYFVYRIGDSSTWRVSNGTGLRSGLPVHERYVIKWFKRGALIRATTDWKRELYVISPEFKYGL